MTERDRLIEIVKKALIKFENLRNDFLDEKIDDIDDIQNVLADYLLANGVIVPPCKVGDKLYPIVDMSHTACKSFVSDFPITVLPYQIYYLNLMGGVSAIPFENFGKTVFLTKEEAEKKLKELGK